MSSREFPWRRQFFGAMICLFSCTGATADTTPVQSHLVTMNSRTFDLRVGIAVYPGEQTFMPGAAIWIKEFLDSDPLMRSIPFYIRASDQSFLDIFGSDTTHFGLTPVGADVAENFPHYLAFTNGKQGSAANLLLKSLDDPIGHVVECSYSYDDGTYMLCQISAAYNMDPTIILQARIFRPIPGLTQRPIPLWTETFRSFKSISDRMREITSCLDVTDKIYEGKVPNDAPPKEPARFLEECVTDIVN